MEKLEADKIVYHKRCFKCQKCKKILRCVSVCMRAHVRVHVLCMCIVCVCVCVCARACVLCMCVCMCIVYVLSVCVCECVHIPSVQTHICKCVVSLKYSYIFMQCWDICCTGGNHLLQASLQATVPRERKL